MIPAILALAPELARVEAIMAGALASDEPRVEALVAGLGGFHGKMLRPSLALLVATALGPVSDDHRRLGAALELIHTATLIHDDMIDEAATRRGRPTAHVAHGTAIAVLLGDYFYTHAFHLVCDLPTWVVRRLTATTNLVCAGELHQMCARRDLALGVAEYERIIHAKTAALTELAGEFGALHGDPAQRAAAAGFGRACGMAFQIVDDCLDVAGDAVKIGKTLATDLERGRLTLPIILTLRSLAGERRTEFEQRLLAVSGPEDVAALRRTVIDGGGLAGAQASARAHVAAAKRHLDALPPGPVRQHLADLADFIVARDF